MKTLLQRFTRWHNRLTERRGNLWEENFKSILVEDGLASRTIAAYIDLNPVRAGMVRDPADYRWSSYGEAMGATGKGSEAKAGDYRMLLLQEGREQTRETPNPEGGTGTRIVRKGIPPAVADAELQRLSNNRDIAISKLLRLRVRYFTDGAVIGSRAFVDDFFEKCRTRFGPKRKSGARKLRGNAQAAASLLWSARDLRKGVK